MLASECLTWHHIRMTYETVIITGASSGFGAAYAHELAPQVRRLILVARREQLLAELRAQLMAQYPQLEVLLQPCDLSLPAARAQLITALPPLCQGATLLINNAGLGDYGEFAASAAERNRQMLEVNISALTELSHALIPILKAEGGAIINIASLAADMFIPDFAIYAASKSYVASFSEALHLELREHGVRVLAVCPGPVHTGFGSVARREGFTGNMTPGKDFFDTDIPTVIQGSLCALARGKARYYPSCKIALIGLLIRSMPLWCMRLILGRRPRRVQSQASSTSPDSSVSTHE